jgi:hypothetical protein
MSQCKPTTDYVKYNFAISKDHCDYLEENKGKETKTGVGFYLPKGYLKEFQKKIIEHEKLTLHIKPSNGIIYPKPKKDHTNYINITAYCKDCSDNIKKIDDVNYGLYKIYIKNKPSSTNLNDNFVTVCVEHHEHFHRKIDELSIQKNINDNQINDDEDSNAKNSNDNQINDDENSNDKEKINTNKMNKPHQLRGDERDEVNFNKFYLKIIIINK